MALFPETRADSVRERYVVRFIAVQCAVVSRIYAIAMSRVTDKLCKVIIVFLPDAGKQSSDLGRSARQVILRGVTQNLGSVTDGDRATAEHSNKCDHHSCHILNRILHRTFFFLGFHRLYLCLPPDSVKLDVLDADFVKLIRLSLGHGTHGSIEHGSGVR